MTTTINASPTNGLVQTADGSGVLKVQSNGVTTNALAWGSYAGAAGAAPTLRSAYNISSVTRNSTGNCTYAFTTALSDANYCVVASMPLNSGSVAIASVNTKTTSSFIAVTQYVSGIGGQGTPLDSYNIDFAVFGN